MRYLNSIKNLYEEHIHKTHEEGRFLILGFFALTFILARITVYGISNSYLNFPPFGFLYIKNIHVHHLVYGIVLLLVAGLIRIPSYGEKYIRLGSILYGIGAALTLDEFAIWLRLDAAAYFGPGGRISIDVVIVFFLIILGSIWHGNFWIKLFNSTVNFFKNKE